MTTLDESADTAAEPTLTTRPAGWYDDPEKLHNQRFFDGEQWTEHVTHFGPLPCSGCAR